MSPEQENHLVNLIDTISKRTDHKYRKGQREHGGNMWRKPGMLYCALQECDDLPVYLHTVHDQIRDMARRGLSAQDVYDFLMSPGEKDL